MAYNDLLKARTKGKKKGGGGLFDFLPDLGVKQLWGEALGIVPGITGLATSVLPGGQPAGRPWAALGKGTLGSFAKLGLGAVDVATLGNLQQQFTNPLREDWSSLLGGAPGDRLPTLTEEYRERGLLPMAVEYVGDVSLAGGLAKGALSAGKVGAAGRAAMELEALGSGAATARQVGAAARWSKRAAKAGDELDPAAVARRATAIRRADRFAHPYSHLFRGAVRPLTRAAQAEWADVRAPRRADGSILPGGIPEPTSLLPQLEGLEAPRELLPPGAPGAPTQTVRISDLEGLEGNQLRYDLGEMTESMRTGGFDLNEPLVLQRNADGSITVREGNHRLAAARAAGLEEVPVRWEAAPDQLSGLESLLGGAGGTVPPGAQQAVQGSPGGALAVQERLPATLDEPALPPGPAMAPREGPHRVAETALQKIPPAQWAQDLVARMPDGAVRFLAKGEDFFERRITRRVFREYERFQESARRTVMHEPVIQEAIAEAKDIVGTKLSDGKVITPEMADQMIGNAVMKAADGLRLLERGLSEPGLIDRLVGATIPLPEELRTPERMARIQSAAAKLRKLENQRLQVMIGDRLGTRGLTKTIKVGDETLEWGPDADFPLPSKGELALWREIKGDVTKARKLREYHIPRQQGKQSRRIAASETKIERAQLEIERLRQTMEDISTELVRGRPRTGFKGGYQTAKLIDRRIDVQRRVIERERRVQRMDENLTEMKRILLENELPTQLQLGKLEGHIQRQVDRLAEALDNPSTARTPGQWKPFWGAIQDLHKMAVDNPQLAADLEGLPQTFSAMLRFAAEEGFDPTFIPSLTEAEVRHLVYEQVRLGKKGREGKLVEEGGRKTRVGAYARSRSISALAAGFLRSTHAANSNALVDFIERVYAREIGKTADGNLFVPKGWVAWDPERNFILTGERVDGGFTVAEGMQGFKPKMMIPRGVKRTIDNMTADYEHSVFSWIKKASNPWRALVLTMRPGWYVNNFVGNLVMATVEGVRLQDWVRGWKSYRQREQVRGPRLRAQFADVPEAGPAASLLREGAPSVVPNPTGFEGLRVTRQEGTRATYEWVMHRMARMNEVVDEISRAAVYHRTRRAYDDLTKSGGSLKVGRDELALTRAFEGLVDYGDLSPMERTIIRSVVPFYAWQKGILKLAFRFGIDHPAALGLMMQLGQLNEEMQQDQYGTELPEAYRGLVNLPGGVQINTRPFNPFADSVQMLTPQGIAASFNPGIEALLRNALGAPEGGFAEDYRINEYGSVVPDTPLAEDLASIFTGAPQATLATGGYGDKPLAQRAAQFGGASLYTEEDVQKMIDRILESKKRVGA